MQQFGLKVQGRSSGILDRTRVIPPETRKEQFESDACAAYPLHSVSLVACPISFDGLPKTKCPCFPFCAVRSRVDLRLTPYTAQEFIVHVHISDTDVIK